MSLYNIRAQTEESSEKSEKKSSDWMGSGWNTIVDVVLIIPHVLFITLLFLSNWEETRLSSQEQLSAAPSTLITTLTTLCHCKMSSVRQVTDARGVLGRIQTSLKTVERMICQNENIQMASRLLLDCQRNLRRKRYDYQSLLNH